MNEEITPEALKHWRKSMGMTQTQFGELIGWDKYVVTNIENGHRKISIPEQKLLRIVMSGGVDCVDLEGKYRIDFTPEESEIITRMAHREGYTDAGKWVASKIRAFLAMLPPEDRAMAPGNAPANHAGTKLPKKKTPNLNAPAV